MKFSPRLLIVLTLVAVIGAGLVARFFRPDADPSTVGGFITTYLGDTLWPVMFFLIARLIWPGAKITPVVLGVLAFTLGIEFLQLWQVPWMLELRRMPVLGFLLGNTFLWSDVICLVVGCASMWLVADLLRRRSAR